MTTFILVLIALWLFVIGSIVVNKYLVVTK